MIRIFDQKMSPAEVTGFLGKPFEKMIKFVVDIKKEKVAFGGELHADGEKVLIEAGSAQEDVWGGNFYPLDSGAGAGAGGKRIEYTSLINIRPSAGNLSLQVRDEAVKGRMQAILEKILP